MKKHESTPEDPHAPSATEYAILIGTLLLGAFAALNFVVPHVEATLATHPNLMTDCVYALVAAVIVGGIWIVLRRRKDWMIGIQLLAIGAWGTVMMTLIQLKTN